MSYSVLRILCNGCWRRLLVTAVLLSHFLIFSFSQSSSDSVGVQKKEMSWLRRTIRGFSYIDENYVEPQHYNWSVMIQGIYNYDFYRLSSTGDNRQTVTFAPSPTFKFGPYFGWRWLFAGYTFDINHVDVSNLKQEFVFSIYAAQLGADIYYRRTGSDYKIRNVSLGKGMEKERFENLSFDGLNVGITGFNVYYIFNHQRFSYPAAFAQSTMQKISCGSWMAGFGYMRNSLELDYEKLAYLLRLSDEEKALMYDLAARKRNSVPSDIKDVMMNSESGNMARMALRMTKAGIAGEEDWKDFIRQLERKKRGELYAGI